MRLKPAVGMSWKHPLPVESDGGDWKRMRVSEKQASGTPAAQPVHSNSWKVMPVQSQAQLDQATEQRHVLHEICIDSATLGLLVPSAKGTSCFKERATDMKHVRQTTAREGCSCTSNCLSLLTNQQVLKLRDLWHSLDEQSQNQFLHCQWSTVETPTGADASDTSLPHRTNWQLEGQRVCLRAASVLLATSSKTLAKRLKGIPDMRKESGSSGKLPLQSQAVDVFFAELYHSTAERLPEQWQARKLDSTDPELETCCGDRDLKTFAWAPESLLLDAFTAPDRVDEGIPKRMLPPGTPMQLFWQFKAWWQALGALRPTAAEMPSWSTWYRRWVSKWSNALGFRKASQHKDCNECFRFRELISSRTLTVERKMQLAKAWQEHLRAQYADRLIFWGIRLASRQFAGVLSLVIDSMDRSKTVFPQYDFASNKTPLFLDGAHRPKLVLTAVIIHGWCTCLFYQHQFIQHGASTACELILRALDVAKGISRRTNRPWPRQLACQFDNTTSQSKNSTSMLLASYLTGTGRFSAVTCNMLPVGHTKEDVDRLFSCVLTKVIRPYKWQTPTEFGNILRREMQSIVAQKQEELHVQQVHHVRDFDSWLAGARVQLYGTFLPSRAGEAAAHSFSFKVRSDLSFRDQAQLRHDRDKHNDDVFALVKGRMHHTSTKPPVLVLPYERYRNLSRTPMSLLPRHVFSDQERKNFDKLISTLRELPIPATAAATAVRAMLDGSDAIGHPPALHILQDDPPPRQRIAHTANEYFEHLPDVSRNLVARFRRS